VETLPGRFELRTDNPWEEVCGHTRAVRRGPFVIIAGTTASDVTKGVLHVNSLSFFDINNKPMYFSLKVHTIKLLSSLNVLLMHC
jgi:hypothetical protein